MCAIAESISLIFAASGALAVSYLTGYLTGGTAPTPLTILLISGTILASTILLLFTFGSSSHLINMKNARFAVQNHAVENPTAQGNTVPNRLVYHASPLTLAYHNIIQSSPRPPVTFNPEKFESGLAGWSDYSRFGKSNEHNDASQPLHTSVAPRHLPLKQEHTTKQQHIEADAQRHPRRYDPLPGTPKPWQWTGNIAQIKRESPC